MARSALLLGALSALAFVGCAVAEEPDDLGGVFDGGAVKADTAAADSSKPASDSSAVDSAAPKPDTAVDDTSTSPIDSSVDDTFVADTSVADTGKADTAKADTFVADTFVADTGGVTDGGACAIQGCSTGSQDRLSCATARVISRRTAGPLGGYNATVTLLPTTSIYDATSFTCIAAGGDQAYKIFVRKGEVVTATANDASDSGSSVYSVVLFESGDCATNVCSGTPKKCSMSSALATASADGWMTIIVSGQTPFDFGSYTIKVTLSGCKTTDCECP